MRGEFCAGIRHLPSAASPSLGYRVRPSNRGNWEFAMLWAGIDEAGYGPNLGPLVMVAVVVETPDERRPDVWGDLTETVGRVNSGDDRLWVDDSKAIYSGGRGRD